MRLRKAKRIDARYEERFHETLRLRRACQQTHECANFKQARERYPMPAQTALEVKATNRIKKRWDYTKLRKLYGKGWRSYLLVYRIRKLARRNALVDSTFCDLSSLDEIAGAMTLTDARKYVRKHKPECL